MEFTQELKKLNKAQRLAVETIEGPVMVVAGPGTGKTQVLTLRIANIRVKTDTPPESILALTFTDAAAGEMRERLVEIMAQDGYKVAIRTFHSFCNELISEYPESFPHIAGGSSVAEVDQIQIIRKLVDDPSAGSGQAIDLELLRSFGKPYGQVRDIIKAISELKREGISPDKFEQIIKAEETDFEEIEDLYNTTGKYKGKLKGKYQTLQRQIAKHKELLKLYRGYQKELLKTQRYDYDDMLIEAASALKDQKSLLQNLHEKYLYILVDEHQDTNSAQNAVLELLTSYDDSPNLFMVGDEKQAIYRFQGASLENFEYFKKRFRKAKVINLEDNYRSTQTIIDAATDIALSSSKGIAHKFGARLKARAGHKESLISLFEFSSVDKEVFGIAKAVQAAIQAGTKSEEIAILYRENKESQQVASMLGRLGISYTISADDDVLTDTQIQKLLRILLAVRHFGQASYLCEALLVDVWGLDPLDVYRFTTYCRDTRLPHYQVIRTLASLKKVGLDDPKRLHRVYQGLAGWKVLADNEGAVKVFEFIVRESGYLAAILKKDDSTAHLAKLHALFDMVKEFMLRKRTGTLQDFIDELELLREHEVRIRPSSIVNSLSSKVNLMTAHKAKGLQFERVYIIGAVDGKWGNRRSRDKMKLPDSIYFQNPSVIARPSSAVAIQESTDSDERNLFYVALTRAKKHVMISYSRHALDGKDLLPSQFTNAIRSELVERVDTTKLEKLFEKERAIEFMPEQTSGVDVKTKAFVREQFIKNGLTPTSLNNYLECPFKYFYLNLVRIPEAPSKFSQFGNAVHSALRMAVERSKNQESITKNQLINYFKTALRREPMTERDEEEMLKKGMKSLGTYFDKILIPSFKAKTAKVLCEFSVEGLQLTKDVTIRGRIDRIDIFKDGSAHVVDYKTGKPKSRNQIAGLTKDSDLPRRRGGKAGGNYYRQLVFYKLLLSRSAAHYELRTTDFILDFVEGPKQEVFAPSDKEVKNLESEIIRVAGEILAGKFKGCGEKDCKYCALGQ